MRPQIIIKVLVCQKTNILQIFHLLSSLSCHDINLDLLEFIFFVSCYFEGACKKVTVVIKLTKTTAN